METQLSPVPIEPLEPPQIDVFDNLLTLARHKILICCVTLLGAGIAAAIALQLPPVYTATAVIMPPQLQRANIQAALGQLASAAALAGAPTMGDVWRSPSELYMALLGSRSVADGVIADQGLMSYYQAKSMERARIGLRGKTAFVSLKDSLVRISVKDRDPRKAAAIANAYIDGLYKLSSRFVVAESAQRRELYEKQLQNERDELAAAELGLRAVQEKTGLLQVSSQVDVTVRSAAQIMATITSREATLATLRAGATNENPEVIRIEREIGSLREQLRRLEGAATNGKSTELILPAGKVPGAGLEYAQALRRVRYHEALMESMARQYEAARLDETKQASMVQVVDYAVPPEIKSGPNRRAIVALGALASFTVCAAFVLLRKYLGVVRESDRARLFWRQLWSFR